MISTLELIAWLTFVAVLWILRELLLGLWAWRKARRFDHLRKVERTRAQFAIIRNRLAKLTIQDRLNPCSVTFNRLYLVNTVFMRSPDSYPELCQALHATILTSKKQSPSPALLKESKTWSPEVRQVVIHTADAMQQVLIDYSWLFRVYFSIARQKVELEQRRIEMEEQRAKLRHRRAVLRLRRAHDVQRIVSEIANRLRSAAQKVILLLERNNPVVFDIRKAMAVMYRMAQ
jgi:hypothetical protein